MAIKLMRFRGQAQVLGTLRPVKYEEFVERELGEEARRVTMLAIEGISPEEAEAVLAVLSAVDRPSAEAARLQALTKEVEGATAALQAAQPPLDPGPPADKPTVRQPRREPPKAKSEKKLTIVAEAAVPSPAPEQAPPAPSNGAPPDPDEVEEDDGEEVRIPASAPAPAPAAPPPPAEPRPPASDLPAELLQCARAGDAFRWLAKNGYNTHDKMIEFVKARASEVPALAKLDNVHLKAARAAEVLLGERPS